MVNTKQLRRAINSGDAKQVSEILRASSTSEIARGSKLGIDATKKLPGEGFKRPWPPLIRMDENVRKKVDGCLDEGGKPKALFASKARPFRKGSLTPPGSGLPSLACIMAKTNPPPPVPPQSRELLSV